MTTAKLHVLGSAHEARFGETFDAELATAIEAAYDPVRAANELDELGILGVPAHYGAAGHYDPDDPSGQEWWGLEADPDDRRLCRHHYTVHYSATRVDVFIFTGVTIAPDQTVVAAISVRPDLPSGPAHDT